MPMRIEIRSAGTVFADGKEVKLKKDRAELMKILNTEGRHIADLGYATVFEIDKKHLKGIIDFGEEKKKTSSKKSTSRKRKGSKSRKKKKE